MPDGRGMTRVFHTCLRPQDEEEILPIRLPTHGRRTVLLPLKEWVDNYESTRFTPIDECRAVITSEYNMTSVRAWQVWHMPIANIEEM